MCQINVVELHILVTRCFTDCDKIGLSSIRIIENQKQICSYKNSQCVEMYKYMMGVKEKAFIFQWNKKNMKLQIKKHRSLSQHLVINDVLSQTLLWYF